MRGEVEEAALRDEPDDVDGLTGMEDKQMTKIDRMTGGVPFGND